MSSDPNRTLPWSTTAARWARFSAASFVAAFCCCGDTDSAARGECLPTRQADVFDESCFYSYCVGPPLGPRKCTLLVVRHVHRCRGARWRRAGGSCAEQT